MNEIRHNQEIAGKPHLVDRLQLKLKPIEIGLPDCLARRLIHLRAIDMPLQPLQQTGMRLKAKLLWLAAPLITGESRQNGRPLLGHYATPSGNHQTVADCFRNIGKQLPHFPGGAKIMLAGIADPVILGHFASRADTDQRIMRLVHFRRVIAAIIGRHQRQFQFDCQRQKPVLSPVLLRHAVALQLDIDTPGTYCHQCLKAFS